MKTDKVNTKALADTLFLNSFIETFFEHTDRYKKFSSDPIDIRRCDDALRTVQERKSRQLTVIEEEEVIFTS